MSRVKYKVVRRRSGALDATAAPVSKGDPFVRAVKRAFFETRNEEAPWDVCAEEAFLDQEAALGWTLVTVAMSVATTDTFGECLDEVRYYFRRVIEDAPYR